MMGNSRTACSIDRHECAIARLHAAGSDGYTITGCSILPFGLADLSPGKDRRFLKKLSRQLQKLRSENLVLCITPDTYLPLPACFAHETSDEEYRLSCMMEAEFFLLNPEDYHCDVAGFSDGTDNCLHEKKLLLFYPGSTARRLAAHFSEQHSILFSCSPQLALLHLSEHSGEPQVILELDNSYMLLAAARSGRLEKFACRQVKSRDEALYFIIRELSANPLFREAGIQVTGTAADKSMTQLIEKETQVKTSPLGFPSSLKLLNPEKFPLSSPSVVKAISTALMALSGNGVPTFSQ